ncbi:MAG TPA: LacI family DNA-binding transcriptional regulator, partial [Bacteroidales bacterium]|nr:LacI family DNA-binding transcriptional regulator [Bacteroidales bacterium]
TQKRVRQRIRELNYKPNMLARGFRTGKTNTIGLIVSDISNRFYSRIARNLEDLAWSHGYTVVVCSTEEKIEKEQEQIRLLRDRKLDGLIISSSQDNVECFEKLLEENIPHVLIDRSFDNLSSASVSVDNFGGARLAARHLLQQGFRKIALVAITPGHISTIRDRCKGFLEALTEEGISIPNDWMILVPFNNIEATIKEKIQNLYQAGKLPEAFFTLNNNLTAECMINLNKLSVEIPKQVALIGFDDVSYFRLTNPSVSVIAQPIEKISETAFDLLLRQIEGNTNAETVFSVKLPVEIIIRESSIKPKNY